MGESFFFWCAGSDENILNECPKSEKIKHFGFGTLVCIPALLGLISMTYAISTFVDNPYVYLGCGILWMLIIFFFDRFAVSTFRKTLNVNDATQKADAIKKDARSLIFITRLILSVLLGIGVSHPISLLFFNGPINRQLDNIEKAATDTIREECQRKIKPLEAQIDTLRVNADKMRDEIRNLYWAVTQEIGSEVASDYTSRLSSTIRVKHTGIPGDGRMTRSFRDNIQNTKDQLAELLQRNTSDSLEITKKIVSFEHEKDVSIENLYMPRDYTARFDAFVQLANLHMWVAYFFIFIFLLMIDVMAILWKVFTQAGPYDYILADTEAKFSKKSSVYYDTLKRIFETIDTEIDAAINQIKDENIKEEIFKHVSEALRQAIFNLTPNFNNATISSQTKKPVEVSESTFSGFILIMSIIFLLIMAYCFGQLDPEKVAKFGFVFAFVYTLLKDNGKKIVSAYNYVRYGKQGERSS